MPHDGLAPWQISATDFPRRGAVDEQLRSLIGYAILAPSTNNTQPWIFHVENDTIELCADLSRALPVVDPDRRELTISCGAALYHLRVAMRHFGWEPDVELLPQGNRSDVLAAVRMGRRHQPTELDRRLFYAIPTRRTHRGQYDGRPLSAPVLRALREAADDEGAWLHVVQGADTRIHVARLITEADIVQGGSKALRNEMADWMRGDGDPRNDGLPAYALGQPAMLAPAERLVLRWLDSGRSQAERDVRLLEGSGALAVLGTVGDMPESWLNAGQAMARILLVLAAEGATAAFLNQPVEVPALRTQLLDAVGFLGHPQLVLRMGYAAPARPTPRRAVSEVVRQPVHAVGA